MNFLSALKALKRTHTLAPSKQSNIGRELTQLIHERWVTLEDPLNDPIHLLINDQLELMSMVEQIHRSEQCPDVSHSLKSTMSFSSSLKSLTQKGRAHRIYLLPEMTTQEETYIIGDLHSDAISLKALLHASKFFSHIANQRPFKLIFLGDYVDRGTGHLELMDWLLALKFIFPEHIYLLRGNHDGGSIENNGTVKTPYSIPDNDDPLSYFPLYIRNLEQLNPFILEPILPNYLAFFESLAVLAIFNSGAQTIMACHGGIPRPDLSQDNWFHYLYDLSALTNDTLLDELERSIVQNIFWSDPTEEPLDLNWNKGRFKYTREHFDAYKSSIGIDRLFRGHEAVVDGVKVFFDNGLTTIYSTGDNLLNLTNTQTAYSGITPKIAQLVAGKVEYLRI